MLNALKFNSFIRNLCLKFLLIDFLNVKLKLDFIFLLEKVHF